MKKIVRTILLILLFVAVFAGVMYLIGGRQYEFTAEVEIRAPADVVFAHLTESDKLTEWVDGLVEVTPDDNQGHRVGARAILTIEQNGTRIEMYDEVLESTKNRSLSVRSECNMFDTVSAFRIEPEQNVVRVKQLLLATHKGVYRVTAPLIRGLIQERLQTDLNNLKSVIEGKRKKSFEVSDDKDEKSSDPSEDNLN